MKHAIFSKFNTFPIIKFLLYEKAYVAYSDIVIRAV